LNPTALFQIDEDFLLVGTQNGKIEMWNIDASKIVKYIDAHSESKAGISSIVELKDPSYLIRGERTEPNPEIRYIVTTCFDKNEFKIWKISPKGTHNRPEISFHIKIETTLVGISKILQASPSQLVCVDNHKTTKFYDFVDRVEQKQQQEFQTAVTQFTDGLLDQFKKIDVTNSGLLDIEHVEPLLKMLIDQHANKTRAVMLKEETAAMTEKILAEMNVNLTGFVTYHEMKSYMTRKYVEINK